MSLDFIQLGALVYIIMAMYVAGAKQTSSLVLMVGLFAGVLLGYLTEFIIKLA